MGPVLFLDDDQNRHEQFKEVVVNFKKWAVTYVWTSQDACDACRKSQFDLAFLDHDLGEASILNGSMFTTELLSDNDILAPKAVIVHSSNEQGARNMVSKFRSQRLPAEWHLFHQVLKMLKENRL